MLARGRWEGGGPSRCWSHRPDPMAGPVGAEDWHPSPLGMWGGECPQGGARAGGATGCPQAAGNAGQAVRGPTGTSEWTSLPEALPWLPGSRGALLGLQVQGSEAEDEGATAQPPAAASGCGRGLGLGCHSRAVASREDLGMAGELSWEGAQAEGTASMEIWAECGFGPGGAQAAAGTHWRVGLRGGARCWALWARQSRGVTCPASS